MAPWRHRPEVLGPAGAAAEAAAARERRAIVRTIVRGKNLDVSDTDRRYVQQKMRRLERLLDDRSEAIVELSVEQHAASSGATSWR